MQARKPSDKAAQQECRNELRKVQATWRSWCNQKAACAWAWARVPLVFERLSALHIHNTHDVSLRAHHLDSRSCLLESYVFNVFSKVSQWHNISAVPAHQATHVHQTHSTCLHKALVVLIVLVVVILIVIVLVVSIIIIIIILVVVVVAAAAIEEPRIGNCHTTNMPQAKHVQQTAELNNQCLKCLCSKIERFLVIQNVSNVQCCAAPDSRGLQLSSWEST